ncbi:MAG TPA: homoserine kinase [Pyrinomonadaceae bacterium]|nr:homoserine kinase [Pyrinomonadaceae bacterium]
MAGKRKDELFEVRVPASTSNLGAGFDCFGLALQLYLTARARPVPGSDVPCQVHISGVGNSASLPTDKTNLIYRSMAFAAEQERLELPPVEIVVRSEIPNASGLGSSGAAVVAGIKLCSLLTKHKLSNDKLLAYATHLEGHPDNVAPSLYGGFVVSAVAAGGEVFTTKSAWPARIKILAITPQLQLETSVARAALPRMVKRADAIHNLQRTALFTTALARRRYDLIWEAMSDRLHQPQRESLVPGLSEVLALPQVPGLLGLALSGAGPSVIALVTGDTKKIGKMIARCFQPYKIKTTTRELQVDNAGCRSAVLWLAGKRQLRQSLQ